MNWENESRLSEEQRLQINDRISADDTLKVILKIANEFYLPVYTDAKYFVIEDTLKYEVCYSDSAQFCSTSQEIPKKAYLFYPFRAETDDSRILYLNSKYNKTFADFFSSLFTDIEKRREDYSAKKNFLRSNLKFFYERIFFWNTDKYSKNHLMMPDLWNIVINARLNEAILTRSKDSSSFETSKRAEIEGNWKFIKIISSGGW